MTSHRAAPRTRRLISVIAAGITLSLTPLPTLATSVQAETPAASVTGLARGARGDAVRDVQQALVNQGITVAGGVDGIFGAGTEAALKEFQGWHGLAKSGKVDLATAIALGLEQSDLLGLTQGNRGETVADLQRTLSAAGFEPIGGADGIFGPGTRQALKDFQAARGFSPSGTVNAATAAALAAVGVSGSSNGSSNDASDSSADDTAADDASNDEAQPDPGATSPLVGLKIGSRGDLVKQIQNALMDAGFTVVGGADGIYGVLTANAVKSFQNANGLDVTGKIDAATATIIELVASDSHDGHEHGDGADDADQHDPTVTSPFVGLQYGSLGADVKQLQQALLDAGINVRGGADGVFGPATRNAVKDFQARHDLEQTGKVDEATANALASRNPAGAASPLIGLKAGALGNTVKQLQQSMLDAGIDVRGGADGIFGPATAQALKAFQTSQGIEATGVVDEATAAALDDPQPVAAADDDEADDAVDDGASDVELGYASYGEKGARVTALQSALVNAGITVRGGVDGDFGGATSAAVMEFQRQNGLSVTGKVNTATADALGLEAAPEPTAPDSTTVNLEYFPVQGRCYFGDSWGYPRSGGRVHLGVDIIAAKGNLIYAVAGGKIDKIYTDYPGSLAGNGVRLRLPDGTYFFYAHMSELAEGIELGVPVRAGQVLGKIGNTGNSGTAHLHLEIHPQGGSAVNPYPFVKAIDGCGNTEPLGLG